MFLAAYKYRRLNAGRGIDIALLIRSTLTWIALTQSNIYERAGILWKNF